MCNFVSLLGLVTMIPPSESISFGYVLMLLFQTEMKVGMSENQGTPESKRQWESWSNQRCSDSDESSHKGHRQCVASENPDSDKTGKLTSNGVHPNEALYNGNIWVHIECEVTSGEFQVSNKFTQVRCNTIAFSKSTNMMQREVQIFRILAIAKTI